MKVAVIGGGPAGLATLKFLATAHEFFPIEPIEARLFEAEASIGGTFVHRVYEDAEVCSCPLSPVPRLEPQCARADTPCNVDSSCRPST